ncbi:MAG: ATP-binding protein [Nitrospirota bacterium]
MKIERILNSIAFRVSVSITVVIAVTTISLGWMTMEEEKSKHERELQRRGRYLADLLSNNVIEPLLYEEFYTVTSLLEGAVKSEDSIIVFGGVYDKGGKVVAKAYKNERYIKLIPPQYDFDKSRTGVAVKEDTDLPFYHLSLPINAENIGTIGYLRLCITKEFLIATLESLKQKIYLLGAAIMFFGSMFGLWMARKVLKPILVINRGVKKIGEGELGHKIPEEGMGEVKELAESFNKMSVELKELVDAIKSAQAKLVRTEKLYAIGEFSAGVAHEIRNPLTSIKLLVQTIRNTGESFSGNDIDIIDKEINRINRIIKSFLEFAKPEKIEKRDVNIKEVLDDVLTISKPKMRHSGIKLIETLPLVTPIIYGNYDALKQVFLNLILNAMQAMDDEGGTLEVGAFADEKSLSVMIKDSGTGISEKDQKKIFDPFFTTKKEGTGMGLALTHNIIDEHSGRIDIESSPGEGTIIKVELPI